MYYVIAVLSEIRKMISQMIPAHSAAITALAFSPEGKFLASYSCVENRLSFWQVRSHTLPNSGSHGVLYVRSPLEAQHNAMDSIEFQMISYGFIWDPYRVV